MAQKKEKFRFRIPWISGAPAPRAGPESQSQSRRPKNKSKYAAQPDTNASIQRPPFRPPGKAPAQSQPPPAQVKGTPRVELKQQSPSRPPQPATSSATVESPLTSQSESPSPSATPTRVNSPTPSPSHAGSPSRVSSPKTQLQSPSRLASRSGIEVPKLSAEESIRATSSASEQEKEKMVVSESVPQEYEPQVVKSSLKTIPKSTETSSTIQGASQPTAEESTLPASSASRQEKGKMKSPHIIIPKPLEISFQTEKISKQPTGIFEDKERSTPPKTKELELESATVNSKVPFETQRKSHQSEEKDKVVHEPIKVGKGIDTKIGQPIRSRAFRADNRQKEAPETVERKMMFATSSSSGNDIKVVSSVDAAIRNVTSSSISPEKPLLSNGEKTPLQKVVKDDISNLVHQLATVNPTQAMDDKQFSIVTLAGDNRGATMHIGTESAEKEGSIHIHRAYRTDPEESTEVTSDGEENSKKSSNNSMEKDEVGKAYVNSNIQSINNSLMLHGSITERDPGVRVILPQQPAEPIKVDDKRGLETPKPEVSINRAEKLTHRPMVRRRCLRGLFLEPSDSDPDKPDKPRRHGCKFSCGETRKDKDMEIM